VIITLVFEKNANFFAENKQKSQKIVIITSTPESQQRYFVTLSPCLFPAAFQNSAREEELRSKVSALKSLTIDIGTEVREHNRLLKDVDDDFDSTAGDDFCSRGIYMKRQVLLS
jgi:IS30 family transposase